MIPGKNNFLVEGFEIYVPPSKTYRMHPGQNVVSGYIENLAAMEQAVYKILNTERYQYPVYSNNYGIETAELFGQPVSYVCPELERLICEALAQDERIINVSGFEFDTSQKRMVKVTFKIHTVYGDVLAGREVSI